MARTLAAATALLHHQQTSLRATDGRGYTLLHQLSDNGSDLSALGAWLLSRCPDLLPLKDAGGNSALLLAVQADNAPMTRLLLARGADLLELNAAGESALSEALGSPTPATCSSTRLASTPIAASPRGARRRSTAPSKAAGRPWWPS